jgi:voltage-dependent potassium channel beta subunit
MQYRRLGHSGLKVSSLSYGSWMTFGMSVDTKAAIELMAAAFDGGVNFFDNAEVYAAGQSEVVMGDALQKLAWDRSAYIVSSKVIVGGEHPTQKGTSRKHLYDACHAAMKRLQVDYLDLLYCHRYDPETPIEEIVYTMTHLIQQGKIRYWGTSEWAPQYLQKAFDIAEKHHLIAPTMEQPQYNLFHRVRLEHDYVRLFEKYSLGTTTWSPLASGLLTGKYNNGIPDDSRAKQGSTWLTDLLASDLGAKRITQIKTLAAIADDLHCTLPQLAIAWCLTNPQVSTVILGASKQAQLKENLGAIAVLDKLDDNTVAIINAITAPDESIIPNYKAAFNIHE